MSTIGIWDADFFRYAHVIPNLECAKLCTYYHNIHEIAVLTPELAPDRFSQFYVRKDYNDYIFPWELRSDNCTYGGRAFNPSQYVPLPDPIEKTIPNMHIYKKYIEYYGTTKTERIQINRILNCAHMRLSTDSKNLKSFSQLKNILDNGYYTGIIFHDYNINNINGAYDLIKELSESRHYVNKEGIYPYPVGNKFPIQVSSTEELEHWLKINPMNNIFFLQYNGLMDNTTLHNLCMENKKVARQLVYNISDCCVSDQVFLNNYALPIFKQVLYLRSHHIQSSLINNRGLYLSKELNDFIELLSIWLKRSYLDEYSPLHQSLYYFCKTFTNPPPKYFNNGKLPLTVDEARNVFQYMRTNYYELFQLFYECDAVNFEGGDFVNAWQRDST